jgi:hypothetical protein
MALVLLLLFVALFVGLFALGTGWFQSGEGRVIRAPLIALAQAAQRGPREDLACFIQCAVKRRWSTAGESPAWELVRSAR